MLALVSKGQRKGMEEWGRVGAPTVLGGAPRSLVSLQLVYTNY